ncbi:YbhB/YbcL family Raf kinase inhibitor-like protein [Brevibacterium samyangense]|uniref:YbhB/YbcL family Raf kinase inhibitor-like protein n=1 Tax=Brevibacterium samyangense TaxID=366888 RepID=A0ABN2T2N5_9MICO
MAEFLNDPFANLADVPTFTVTSETIEDGGIVPEAQRSAAFGVPGGEDESPQLSWSGFPEETKAFAVTCYDPEAPTGSGFWHWVVADIPADVTSLPLGAGTPGSDLLPAGAVTFRNDGGAFGYIGAAPPAGHGPHRYFFIVHALSEPLGLDDQGSPAFVGFNMFFKSIGRAWITATFEAE